MGYEIDAFLHALKNGDRLEMYRKISEDALKLTDEARRQTEIHSRQTGKAGTEHRNKERRA